MNINSTIKKDLHDVHGANEQSLPFHASPFQTSPFHTPWLDQKTPESELNANAAPFILASKPGPPPFISPDNNNLDNDTFYNQQNQYTQNQTNQNNDLNHWDFQGALDESYSALYFNDKFESGYDNNNNIYAESGYDDWTDDIDKELIKSLTNEIYNEFHQDIDLKHIKNAMEMGIYHNFDAVYSDFADIWLNAKRLEKCLLFKLSHILSTQRLHILKSNKEFKFNGSDPFAVLDDLVHQNKISNDVPQQPLDEYYLDDTSLKCNTLDRWDRLDTNTNIDMNMDEEDELRNPEKHKKIQKIQQIMTKKTRNEHSSPHEEDENALNLNIMELYPENQRQNKKKPPYRHRPPHENKNKNQHQSKYENKKQNQNQNQQRNRNRNKNKKATHHKEREQEKAWSKPKKVKQKLDSELIAVNDGKNKPKGNKNKNRNKNNQKNKRNKAKNEKKTKEKTQKQREQQQKQKQKEREKLKQKEIEIEKERQREIEKEKEIQREKQKQKQKEIEREKEKQRKKDKQKQKQKQKRKQRQKEKQKEREKEKQKQRERDKEKQKQNKNKHKNKQNKNKNKTTPKSNPNANKKANKNQNKDNKNKENKNKTTKEADKEKEVVNKTPTKLSKLQRNALLQTMTVSELKNILKLHTEESEYATFCEKPQFVSAIIAFESKITARKAKWSKFADKYPHLLYKENAEIICKNHKKYLEAHTAAEKEKNFGNDALKNGDYNRAIKHYTQSIKHQIDYKAAYTNRSLVYLKQAEYDKCITDCTTIIEMIKMVDSNMLKSNEMFKSYLRRGQAYKLQKKYFLAKHDLDLAVAIIPNHNDSSVSKLLADINKMCKKSALRKKLRAVGTLNDFNSILNLSLEFMENNELECKESDELLRRLFVFLYKNKKCCMLFASNKGHILCLKYLQTKFDNFSKENMGLFGKLYCLLNRSICYIELSNNALLSLISGIVACTFKYFVEMHTMSELQSTAMRFVSLMVGNDCARNFIVQACGESIILYFSKFQTNANSKLIAEPRHCKGLFESLSFLFRDTRFVRLLLKQNKVNGPCYIYQVFLDSFFIYNQALKKGRKNTEKPLQFAISVLLDGLSIIFDGALNNPLLNKTEQSEIQLFVTDMTKDFVSNNMTHTKYMKSLKEYFSSTQKNFLKHASNENEAVAYLSQIVKCMNVFAALSNVFVCIEVLFKHNIYEELISLIAVCDKAPTLSYYSNNVQMQSMLNLTRNNILTYFDHISNDKRFDALFADYFWKHLMDVFVQKYNGRPYPKAIQQFGHNKSCAIRCVYRWLHRGRGDNNNINKGTNKLLEVIIFKYFNQMLDCLLMNDEQVLANAPLVLSECVKYILHSVTSDKSKLIKFLKQAFTQKRIMIIIKLMKTKHAAIQYNAMLLVAQISEIDQELHQICSIYGALKLLVKYDEARQLKNVDILKEPLHFD